MKCNLKKESKDYGNISMNLYDLNKSIVSQLPIADNTDPYVELINDKMKNYSNLMLLCKEISYYTIFYPKANEPDFENKGEAVLTCALDIGKIITVDYMEASDTIEIWVRTNKDENLCMCLFDCEGLMVSYGG